MIHGSKCQITSQCQIKPSAQANGTVLRERNITLKDCRLCTLKTIPSVASHLPAFYFWCSKKRCTSQQTLHFLSAVRLYSYLPGRERNTWDEQWKKKKNALMQFMSWYSAFTFSIQFPSLIALLLIQSLPYARCGPDTTDPEVWELSVKVIQESSSEPVRVKSTASHFPQTSRTTERP